MTNLRRVRPRTVLTLVFLLLFLSSAAGSPVGADEQPATSEETPPSTAIDRWLVAGPAVLPLPAFADAAAGGVEPPQLLEEVLLPDRRVRPSAGESLRWIDGTRLEWKTERTGRAGTLAVRRSSSDAPSVAWLVSYLHVDRYTVVELELGGTHPRRVWLDGEPLVSGGDDASKDEPVEAKLELVPGSHTVLIKTVLDPARETDWTVSATLQGAAVAEDGWLRTTVDPARDLAIHDILDPPRITSLSLAPDGRSLVIGVSRIVPGTDDTESWVEIRSTDDGTLLETWRGATGLRNVEWSPDGRFVSYVAKATDEADQTSTLFLYDVKTRSVKPLLERVERLGGYRWSPTGEAIVYSTTREAEKDERGVKRLTGLLDRWANYRDRSFLHLVTVPDGSRRTLTAGEWTTDAVDISPDGKRLLFTRRLEQLDERPFTLTELWEMELASGTTKKLREFRWFNSASYGPDGKRLLIGSAADAFGAVGVDLEDERIPNSYDGQLFIWNPRTDEVVATTAGFDPAVTGALWSAHDGRIYLTAEMKDYEPLFVHDPESGEFTQLDTGYDVHDDLTVAHSAGRLALLASSPWVPERLVTLDTETLKALALAHPSGDWFDDVRMGEVRPWSFEASNGKTIDGRVYLPPGFDAERRYPAIVYYYGGTSPVGRGFGGRYPKEWWAANGYVVYVLQPSGATGFGQPFSADHVNDWGKTTSEEIVEGTRRFLEAHPFVDGKRVGCIGASYGGFMTMLLSTKTDLYAAAVAHAGISSLASYWGEGYWGFLYSAVATAGSYPWNRKDIYVDQSPLFRADRNRVPILLTHGVEDTNVPVGESDAFYIALKLLDKDVEYLQIAGQDHWIVDHAKRVVWSRSILAWFDRRLKDRPEWWEALYPSAGASAPESE